MTAKHLFHMCPHQSWNTIYALGLVLLSFVQGGHVMQIFSLQH